ncbi:uncharacterized protein GLRG_03048 [Colletotrichum graminicola M1.001]|uniref:Uncharacterized protein n=1 Tax=Colletotrichum graminicola (strain M1.001 / M2 / FGSC 10212) TaxID=645133 RepID=E3QAL6_COLGM|nr:uncharacterized protein GLRG_03048 [Colletotrichum graminicola M1.001]EFQ27904.1 hypothetical protein GLRG_03048 [Colletotrichum graminicola M1.001]
MADRTSRQAPPPGAPRRQVRRNLFQGLTRRPTGPTGASAAATTTSAGGAGGIVSAAAAGAGSGNGMAVATGGGSSSGASAETLRLDVDVLSDGGGAPVEIVVRDEHGEVELGELPTLVFDEADEVAATDDREESNKERQRLAEAVKQHQVNHTAIREQPEELLEAVRVSLRAKVAALAEDNWMYEAEPELPRAF